MDDFTPIELARLADYFAQELPPEEAALAERWINGDPDTQSFVRDLQRSRLDFGAGLAHGGHIRPSSGVEAISQNLAQARAVERKIVQVQDDSPSRDKRSYLRRPMFGAMFCSVLLIVAGWFAFNTLYPSSHAVEMATYETANGERATVTLPDGSIITLNVGSRLQVPVNYSDDNRTLTLVGEALFTVTHHEKTPFTVISGPSTTRVLGTRFAVRHYPTDAHANIAVQEGKVSVGDRVLSAGQQLSINQHSTGKTLAVDETRFNFAADMLTLDRVSMVDAIPELNRWYNANIQLGDLSLGSRKIIGGFKLGSLTDLAAILELTFDVRVVRAGNTLTLYRK